MNATIGRLLMLKEDEGCRMGRLNSTGRLCRFFMVLSVVSLAFGSPTVEAKKKRPNSVELTGVKSFDKVF